MSKAVGGTEWKRSPKGQALHDKFVSYVSGKVERGEAEAIVGIPQQGTEWTEPGQGATLHELSASMSVHESGAAAASEHLLLIAVRRGFGSWGSYRTNLRLTGAPLTAEDIENIGRAK